MLTSSEPPTTSSNSTPLGIRIAKASMSATTTVVPADESVAEVGHTTHQGTSSDLNAAAVPFVVGSKTGGPVQGPDDIGYTSPWTGATLTKAEVREYARGKTVVDENGETVTVFFKRSFVEDPWAKLARS